MAIYTTVQIAALVEKSERTVQLWLQKGTLKGTHQDGNRWEVNESDLAHFLPHHVADTLVARLESLERRVTALEALSSNKPTRAARAPSRPSATSSTLPDGYVPIADLIKQHNAPETTAMRHMRPLLHVGRWKTSEGKTVTYALDAEGQAEFIRHYGNRDQS